MFLTVAIDKKLVIGILELSSNEIYVWSTMLCNLFGSEHCSEIVCDINMVEFKAEHLLSVRWSASGERDPYFCSKTVIWLYDLKKKKFLL